MKTILLVGAAGTLAWLALSPIHKTAQVAEPVPAAQPADPHTAPNPATIDRRNGIAQARLAEARKFDLDIQTILPHGEAIALAASNDISPTVTTSPEKLPPAKAGGSQAGQIYVTGLPDGLIGGQHHLTWLIPAGTKTYTDVRGGYHTVPAYVAAPAPPTVENKPKSGAWMYEGSTALDRRTKANGLR